jgi:hypothetical protein
VAVPPFRRLVVPICRSSVESHPTCAIVHASSTLASRIGAAGYKLMRLSHVPWTSQQDLPIHGALPPPRVRLLVPSCSRPARTSLTVALRAILDPPLRATAALIERPGRENVRLGAKLENWGEEEKAARDVVRAQGGPNGPLTPGRSYKWRWDWRGIACLPGHGVIPRRSEGRRSSPARSTRGRTLKKPSRSAPSSSQGKP